MKASVWGLSATLILTLFFTSCRHKQEIASNDIKFDTISISRYHHLNNDSTLPSCNLKINIIYPLDYKDKEILSKIQKIFTSGFCDDNYANMPIKEALEKYTEDYIKNYIDDAKFFFDETRANEAESQDKYFSYYENLSNKILFNKADLVSMQIIQSNKKGNNKSFRQFLNYVIDMKTGNTIDEEDIFNEGYEKGLNAIFKEKLLTANNAKSIKDLEDDFGYMGIDEMTPNNNFLVDEKGITYVFNKGEYSVPKSDEINIFVSYNELRHILKEQSPISMFYTE